MTFQAKVDQLKLMCPVILNGILKLLDGYLYLESDTIARETKTFSYQAIGLLAQRLPQLFRDKVEIAVHLFDALKVEVPSLRLIVQEATNSLASAYMGAPATVLMDLEKLLPKNTQAVLNLYSVNFVNIMLNISMFYYLKMETEFFDLILASSITCSVMMET